MDRLREQKLLRKDGSVVPAAQALEDKTIVLYYFSAHWCPPCTVFTPILNEVYTELIKEGEPLEVVFVSLDKSPEDMMAYMKEAHGDWLAVQHGAQLATDLKKMYNVTGIPTVIVVTRDGQLISKSGRSEVTEKGAAIFQNWITAAK